MAGHDTTPRTALTRHPTPRHSKTRVFLAAALSQAKELRRSFVATLILSRRRQFAVVGAIAAVAGLLAASVVNGAEQARATWSTCPTLPPPSADVVPGGWRVVALPRDIIAPGVSRGDRVDLVANSETVAGGAIVVTAATETEGITVAVPPQAAPVVATAAQAGDISVLALG